MGKLFNLDNPVWNFMGKLADLIVLNIIAIICSLPIFTIGATWTAMYYVTVKMVKKEEGYLIRGFFHSFKTNFKQATIIWLLALLLIGIFAGDFMIYRAIPDQIPKAIIVIVIVLAILVFNTILYVFPLLSRFDNTIKNTIKNAFLISIINLPYTLMFVVLFALPFIVMLFSYRIYMGVFLVGFTGPAYLASMLWVRIFKKFEPEEEAITDDMDFSINESPE